MISIIMEIEKGGPLGSKALLNLLFQKFKKRGWMGEFLNLHNRIGGGLVKMIVAMVGICKVVMEDMVVINKVMSSWLL
jgi:hypothetical protein